MIVPVNYTPNSAEIQGFLLKKSLMKNKNTAIIFSYESGILNNLVLICRVFIKQSELISNYSHFEMFL